MDTTPIPKPGTLESDLRDVLNHHSAENESDTPDYILATYLIGCLEAFNAATRRRDNHTQQTCNSQTTTLGE